MPSDGVPYALTLTRELADPLTAPKVERGYTCFVCGGYVHVRRGSKRVAHFAHYTGASGTCSPESVEHRAAKQKLATLLHGGVQLFQLDLPCSGHINEYGEQVACTKRVKKDISCREFDTVAQEVAFGPYVLDVAALAAGEVVLGIEIEYSHGVDEAKNEFLMSSGVPWFEVQAHSVLRSNMPWSASRSSHGDVACDTCQNPDRTRKNSTVKFVTRIRSKTYTPEQLAALHDLRTREVPVARNGEVVAFPEHFPEGSYLTCLVCKNPVAVGEIETFRTFLHDKPSGCDPAHAWQRAGMLAAYKYLKRHPRRAKLRARCLNMSKLFGGLHREMEEALPVFDRVVPMEPSLMLTMDGRPVLQLAFAKTAPRVEGVRFATLSAKVVARHPWELWCTNAAYECDHCVEAKGDAICH